MRDICDHIVGRYWLSKGDGIFHESERSHLEYYEQHRSDFKFVPFDRCPKCGVKNRG